ncbi:MAG: lysophospholipid acyltransferase family protein [Deltaproteobacteria bacterium]|nr:lysophospholipid acyltransferase family protein [Deltaproteobacteria bacterium]
MSMLPARLVIWFGRMLGLFWYYVAPVRVGVARSNVERVYGDTLSQSEKAAIVRGCCMSWAMTVMECLRMPTLRKPGEIGRMEAHNFHLLEAAKNRKKGACVVTLHLGNFEMMVGYMTIHGLPLHVIYRDLKAKSVHDFWNLVRKSTGILTLPPRRSKDAIREVMAKGEMVGFAVDQHMPKHRAIVCEFLGHVVATSPAPSKFAMEAEGEIVLVHTYRSKDDYTRHICEVEDFPLESPFETFEENLRHNTQRLNNRMAEIIKAHPTEWLWHHKRFKVHDSPEGWEVPQELVPMLAKKS